MNPKDRMREEQEALDHRIEEANQHSLVCNNELFNKELWAIVDDTAHEND